jgi:hypothetical protein
LVSDESKDAVIAVPSMKAEAAVMAPTILISAPFWLYWSEIAIESENSAWLHRMAADRASPGRAMIEETKASMTALTACAHALDAFCGKFADDIMPRDLLKKWQAGEGNRRMQIWDTLRHGFDVNTHAWKSEIVWLFRDRRNPALHHAEKTKETVGHPLGPHTAPEMVGYSAESSSRAADLLLDVFDKCSAAPKPPAASKANAMRYQVEGLFQLRERLKSER